MVTWPEPTRADEREDQWLGLCCSLDEAVEDGWLVKPQAVSVPLRIPTRRLNYDDLSDAEKADRDATDWPEDGQIPTEVTPDEIKPLPVQR